MIVFLDTGVLGLVTHPLATKSAAECNEWLADCLDGGCRVCVPELADYELRRELIRGKLSEALAKLDALNAAVEYVPVSTKAFRLAAEYWAKARNQGTPTADDKSLDGDMILSAQAEVFATEQLDRVVIATDNVGHLSIFADAKRWVDI